MSCAVLPALTIGERMLDCLGSGAFGWGLSAALLVFVLSGLLVALRDRRSWPVRLVGLAGYVAVAWLLLASIERPVLTRTVEQVAGGQIVVVLDGSDSVWRDRESARGALRLAADRVEDLARGLQGEDANLWRGRIIVFGASAEVEGAEMSLADLGADLRRREVTVPSGDSALTSGLRAALGLLDGASGRREVILISDGLAEAPGAGLLAELRAAGVAVHVVATGSKAPSRGLVAANLGPEFLLGQEAVIRATVLGEGVLEVRQGGEVQPVVISPSDSLRGVRLSSRFPQRGLQGVRLEFETGGGRQQRDLFALVRGPARVLVFGPAPWAEGLPPARWQVVRATPEDPPDPAAFDLVIVDSLAPTEFPAGFDADLLQSSDSTGLLLINGAMRGTREDPQRISDWNGSALSPILPVDSDPRAFQEEPPPRDIVVMVDVSGSMAGVRLGSAQSAILAILRQLRPRDSIAILPFSDGTMPSFAKSQATPGTLDAARRFVAGLTAGGGTAPESTIAESAKFVSNYCAFFFISDADFAPPTVAPQCFTTAISVSDTRFPIDVSAWGEEILVGEGGNAANISLRYFDPEEREEYFREGAFAPLSADSVIDAAGLPLVDGLAIAYPRQDAVVRLLHPVSPPDPLFAFRRDSARPGVVTGVFLGPMGAEWGGRPETERLLSSLLGWADQDRYLVQLEDEGAALRLWITELAAERVAAAGQISATVQWQDGTAGGVALQYNARLGSWTGTFPRPRSTAVPRGLLSVQDGKDIQRIPLAFAALDATTVPRTEALQFGTDDALLQSIAAETNGTWLDQMVLQQAAAVRSTDRTPLHNLTITLAFLLLSVVIWWREFKV
jgi:hypothetical protein